MATTLNKMQKKSSRPFQPKNKNRRHIQKEEAFEIKYLNQDKPETIQYVQKLLVNNSCFFRKYEAGKDSPKQEQLLTLMRKASRTTILYRNENKSAVRLYSLVLSYGL